MDAIEHDVVIAGGGPTGLMLAGELALAGVDVAVVERRVGQELPESRAGGLHSRTIEVLDQRGIADRFLSRGKRSRAVGFATSQVDIGDLPTRHGYLLGLWQNHTEHELAGWVGELDVPVYRGREVIGFAQDDSGVDIEVSDGGPMRARYLVGCDGGRSLVRKTAGIDFPGWDPTFSCLVAEVEVERVPDWLSRQPVGPARRRAGSGKGTPVRIVVAESRVGRTGEASLHDLSEALIAEYGTDYGVSNPSWISRFGDTSRQAASYRDRRVLLAGDAAHVHAPVSGQGLNLGVQDAVNLGWKLAQVVAGASAESLLDTYHAERHPVAARVLRHTMAQHALLRTDERTRSLRDIMSELLSLYEPRQRVAAMIAGLDIRYDCGEGHPLLGRRMPDLDLVTADGPRRVFTLLHQARPVLLNLGEPNGFDVTPWAGRIRSVDAKAAATWELPLLGEVAAPAALVIRPDGYVAWAGELTDASLPDALTSWFGEPE
ncbi:FAD-dependent monooxygenase [Stackebrandtia nassauensis]|uniref:Monooxygenase FAD-binding protein n=1 Tax=Stackebrandtia nassauensis (strain DSM 44728 / CIP 108903 / NRRL B-16338 / NBRC 102104 / LLR-40K-21) TaxID=446470 RepID=D3Q614_STANL|nr:FAD-dependent monooxygenase [Stackebrandtia nassauensis]ADD40313.1 monooxygenase FAD-binding protein [Stackebrandtia nassauensis DSM 44728]